MSRGLPQLPTITRSGTTKISQPIMARTAAAPLNPVCSQFSGDVTVTPDLTH